MSNAADLNSLGHCIEATFRLCHVLVVWIQLNLCRQQLQRQSCLTDLPQHNICNDDATTVNHDAACRFFRSQIS